MRKILSLLIVLIMLCAIVMSGCQQMAECDELVVYNCADYIYDFQDEFKEYYYNLTGRNINVTYVTYDTNETLLTKISKSDSIVDVMCTSEYAIQQLLEKDLLIPLNYFDESIYTSELGEINEEEYEHFGENIDANITNKVREIFGNVNVNGVSVDMTDYFVPYMYGTLGILYNKVYFEELGIYDADILNDANWGILFNDNGNGDILSEGLTNHIYMKDSIRDSYAAAMFYMQEVGIFGEAVDSNGNKYSELSVGELINTVDEFVLDKCSETLKKQKEQLYGYEVDFGKNELIQGIAYVDLAWSGDALYSVEESYDDEYGDYTLSYYVPHSTGNIWFDGWVIPKNCQNTSAARLFINFLNNPYVAAQNMMEIGYSSAVDPNKILDSDEAMAVLYEGYNVNSQTYIPVDEDGNEVDLSTWEYDYESEFEFQNYFFYNKDADGEYLDKMSNANWRYPFLTENANANFDRKPATSLGVMQDFGKYNNAVTTMWEDVRSTGITAWALLLWTVAVIAVAVGIVAVVYIVKDKKKLYVKVK